MITRLLLTFAFSLVPWFASAELTPINGLYVNAFDDKANQSIVFLHDGPASNSYDFEVTTAAPLAKLGFYVVVYDQRGQGRSVAANQQAYNYTTYATDLKNIVDGLGLTQPILMAHGHGVGTALRFEQNYPNFAKKIILVSAVLNYWKAFHTVYEEVQPKVLTRLNSGPIILASSCGKTTQSTPTPPSSAIVFHWETGRDFSFLTSSPSAL